MADRDRDRDRVRDRERDRERDRRREKDDRERDRPRSKRSRTPDRIRSRHTRSPDRRHSRSHTRSPDRSRRHHRHRSPSTEPPRKRHRHDGENDGSDRKHVSATAAVSEFVDGIAREQQKQNCAGDGEGVDVEMDADEIELMKKMGIPVGFDSTKGKPVHGADVSGVRAMTKRQPRQYMNRRGGFNRPLPAERNR